MNFESQANFIQLRDIVAEKTSPIILWLGSGLSVPAGFPNWIELRDSLLANCEKEIDNLEERCKPKARAQLKAAKENESLWCSFSIIKEILLQTGYERDIRNIFKTATTVKIPQNYLELMKLIPRGIITTNVDKIVSRAYLQAKGATPVEFDGRNCKQFSYVLQDERNFILNLHGNCESIESLVFTQEDLDELDKSGCKNFITTCLHSKIMIFVGISISDVAIRKHLENMDVGSGSHFWITADNTENTRQFCGNHHILPIYYDQKDDHAELGILIQELIKYRPQETIPTPIVPDTFIEINDVDIDTKDFFTAPANMQRKALNIRAMQILNPGTQEAYKQYQQFREKYGRHIHIACYVSTKTGENELLDYKLKDIIGSGAFGDVYLAEDKNGNDVAIKILKGEVLKDDLHLQAFRRGVHSMQILSKSNVCGMVSFHESCEIPTFVVMDYVAGCNLKQAIEAKGITDWQDKLTVLARIAEIIRDAHHLPERVLHRDLRPQNIMLNDFWDNRGLISDITVLDFDLSWYKDANELSIDHAGSNNGFLAPELLHRKNGFTRNALVDSFGIGMLTYYIVTGDIPLLNQHIDSNWEHIIFEKFSEKKCSQWVSLPNILARLVARCTADEQILRLDMSQIYGKFYTLKMILENRDNIKSCDLVAEEIGARVAPLNYKWNSDTGEAKISKANGTEIIITADENNRKIAININWSNLGTVSHSAVKRRIQGVVDGIYAVLKKNEFSEISPSFRTDQLSISCTISQPDALVKIDEIAGCINVIYTRYLAF